ncbi:hypothetical protein DPEC_G00110050 [Dallia pectoralis]|uniref:Uncharacterized protein n=1 Tax=Dallia pectoralis TaxID=75939 RepID=A0ACC2GTC3_DALPE|nr:hypothetical protein DPEC_G00110050 [Dallia pectoralis]
MPISTLNGINISFEHNYIGISTIKINTLTHLSVINIHLIPDEKYSICTLKYITEVISNRLMMV